MNNSLDQLSTAAPRWPASVDGQPESSATTTLATLADVLLNASSAHLRSSSPEQWNLSSSSQAKVATTTTDATTTANLSGITEEEEIRDMGFPPKREDLATAIPLTVIFALLLATGCIGNLCTAIVIARPKNKYMHTATNYYLFSLAMSDFLFLILGLPQEMYTLWQRYPYAFGEYFCRIRGYLSEATTYASILTITAFTVERYVAICHPLWAHTMSQLPRAIKSIIIIWLLAAVCAIPPAYDLGLVYDISPRTNRTLLQTAQCASKGTGFVNMFVISAIVFFIVPMIIVTVLYILIAVELRRSSKMNSAISKQASAHLSAGSNKSSSAAAIQNPNNSQQQLYRHHNRLHQHSSHHPHRHHPPLWAIGTQSKLLANNCGCCSSFANSGEPCHAHRLVALAAAIATAGSADGGGGGGSSSSLQLASTASSRNGPKQGQVCARQLTFAMTGSRAASPSRTSSLTGLSQVQERELTSNGQLDEQEQDEQVDACEDDSRRQRAGQEESASLMGDAQAPSERPASGLPRLEGAARTMGAAAAELAAPGNALLGEAAPVDGDRSTTPTTKRKMRPPLLSVWPLNWITDKQQRLGEQQQRRLLENNCNCGGSGCRGRQIAQQTSGQESPESCWQCPSELAAGSGGQPGATGGGGLRRHPPLSYHESLIQRNGVGHHQARQLGLVPSSTEQLTEAEATTEAPSSAPSLTTGEASQLQLQRQQSEQQGCARRPKRQDAEFERLNSRWRPFASHRLSLARDLDCRHRHHHHHHYHHHHHHSGHHHHNNCQQQQNHQAASSRKLAVASSKKSVIRMLVAVVVSFFICWVPFHAQRLLASHLRHEDYQKSHPVLMDIYRKLTYISGVMYYLSSTINPLLYQLMSAKFRLAFKETFKCSLFRCATFSRSFGAANGSPTSSMRESNLTYTARLASTAAGAGHRCCHGSSSSSSNTNHHAQPQPHNQHSQQQQHRSQTRHHLPELDLRTSQLGQPGELGAIFAPTECDSSSQPTTNEAGSTVGNGAANRATSAREEPCCSSCSCCCCSCCQLASQIGSSGSRQGALGLPARLKGSWQSLLGRRTNSSGDQTCSSVLAVTLSQQCQAHGWRCSQAGACSCGASRQAGLGLVPPTVAAFACCPTSATPSASYNPQHEQQIRQHRFDEQPAANFGQFSAESNSPLTTRAARQQQQPRSLNLAEPGVGGARRHPGTTIKFVKVPAAAVSKSARSARHSTENGGQQQQVSPVRRALEDDNDVQENDNPTKRGQDRSMGTSIEPAVPSSALELRESERKEHRADKPDGEEAIFLATSCADSSPEQQLCGPAPSPMANGKAAGRARSGAVRARARQERAEHQQQQQHLPQQQQPARVVDESASRRQKLGSGSSSSNGAGANDRQSLETPKGRRRRPLQHREQQQNQRRSNRPRAANSSNSSNSSNGSATSATATNCCWPEEADIDSDAVDAYDDSATTIGGKFPAQFEQQQRRKSSSSSAAANTNASSNTNRHLSSSLSSSERQLDKKLSLSTPTGSGQEDYGSYTTTNSQLTSCSNPALNDERTGTVIDIMRFARHQGCGAIAGDELADEHEEQEERNGHSDGEQFRPNDRLLAKRTPTPTEAKPSRFALELELGRPTNGARAAGE